MDWKYVGNPVQRCFQTRPIYSYLTCAFPNATIARGQHERIGPSQHIGQGMDLGCPAAARTTDRLPLAPPFPPNAERWALM